MMKGVQLMAFAAFANAASVVVQPQASQVVVPIPENPTEHFFNQLKPNVHRSLDSLSPQAKQDLQEHVGTGSMPQPGDKFLDGLYIIPCQKMTSEDGKIYNLSMAQTILVDHSSMGDDRFYWDTTVYAGNIDCRPDLTNVFYKAMYNGTITFTPPPILPNSRTKNNGITLNTVVSQFVLGKNYPKAQIDLLTKYCGYNCGVKWSATEDLITIHANQCRNPGSGMPPDAPDECSWATGQTWYSQFFVNDTIGAYFTEGVFNLKAKGWNDNRYIIGQAPFVSQTFNSHNPAACLAVATKCETYIDQVVKFCDACDESRVDAPKSDQYGLPLLECDGCMFRTAKYWMKYPNEQYYDVCCPCFEKYAESGSYPSYLAHINC